MLLVQCNSQWKMNISLLITIDSKLKIKWMSNINCCYKSIWFNVWMRNIQDSLVFFTASNSVSQTTLLLCLLKGLLNTQLAVHEYIEHNNLTSWTNTFLFSSKNKTHSFAHFICNLFLDCYSYLKATINEMREFYLK